jgi:hypothetical protein
LESNEDCLDVITIGGGLLGVLGVSCSGTVFSVPVVSVFMSVVVRDEKRLRVITAFGGSWRPVDAGTGLVDFLAVCEVLLDICFWRLFTAWKSSSWAVNPTEVFHYITLPCLCTHLRGCLQFSQCYGIHAAKSAR